MLVSSLVRAARCSRRRQLFSSQHFQIHSSAKYRNSSTPSSSTSPQLEKIVDDISHLTLLQAADLVALLKARLNIQEIAMPSMQAATTVSPSPVEEAQPEEEKPKEKTVFNVKIESIDPASKAKIIREVKAQVPNLNLMDAKKFVESIPKVVKENLNKEDAEKLKATFEALGAVILLD